jgi:hypothetical protein
MKKSAFTKNLLNARSLLLIGVLLTLCISEGVGLQLLPFPTNGEHNFAESARIKDAADCSSVPAHVRYKPCRIEMIAPKLKERIFRQQLEHIVAALVFSYVIEADSIPKAYIEQQESSYSLRLACKTSGRAPPPIA